MFDDLNPQGFYPGENLPKLSNPPKKDPQKRSQKKALQLALSLADGLNQLPAGEIHCSGLPVCVFVRSAGGTSSAP